MHTVLASQQRVSDLAGDAEATPKLPNLHTERVTEEIGQRPHAGGMKSRLEALRTGD